VENRLPYD